MPEQEYLQVIGIIDHHRALHFRKLKLGELSTCHESIWPTRWHKRWRFSIPDWQVVSSVLSEKLNEEEVAAVEDRMRKVCTPPRWFLEGEIWEKLGRPRKGPKYKKYLAEVDRLP